MLPFPILFDFFNVRVRSTELFAYRFILPRIPLVNLRTGETKASFRLAANFAGKSSLLFPSTIVSTDIASGKSSLPECFLFKRTIIETLNRIQVELLIYTKFAFTRRIGAYPLVFFPRAIFCAPEILPASMDCATITFIKMLR